MTKELAELEERADELSKARSATLSSISYINERNRKRNVERAEEAILEEIRASGGQKAEDPFTRRSTKPRMIHRPNQDVIPGNELISGMLGASVINSGNPASSTSSAPQRRDESSVRDNEKTIQVPKPKTSDLFSAHDFDIKIDLEVPLPCEYMPFFMLKISIYCHNCSLQLNQLL